MARRRGSCPINWILPFEGRLVGAAGSMLGSGAIMVMDHTTDIPAAALTLTRFYAHESCGKCTPCREGGTWLMRILERIVAGQGTERDLEQILEVGVHYLPWRLPPCLQRTPRLGRGSIPLQDDHDLLRRSVGICAMPIRRSPCSVDEFEAKIVKRTFIPVSAVPAAVGVGQ